MNILIYYNINILIYIYILNVSRSIWCVDWPHTVHHTSSNWSH